MYYYVGPEDTSQRHGLKRLKPGTTLHNQGIRAEYFLLALQSTSWDLCYCTYHRHACGFYMKFYVSF